jgi:multidrug resistance efflux pump
MRSLIEELRRREAAARAEAERLRARIGEFTEELARAEELVTRLVITREEVTRVLEEPPAADTAPQESAPAGKPGRPRWRARRSRFARRRRRAVVRAR